MGKICLEIPRPDRIPSKKPAVEETATPKSSEDMLVLFNSKLKLLNEPWKDLPFEKQQQILNDLPPPTRDIYNAFHKSMACGKDTPTWWREKYEDIQAQKMERGRNTNKIHDLQAMCKGWWAMSVSDDGTMQTNVLIILSIIDISLE